MGAIDLGELGDSSVIERFCAPLQGRRIVDIGCGKGALARELVARGAQVVGVEPDPQQAAQHRAAAPAAGLTFIETSAESLPLETGSFDAAVFGRSLHHIPQAAMAKALLEAARVLDPRTGVMLVLEPTLDGPYSRVMLPFHDETAVRTAAQSALARHVAPRFRSRETYVVHTLSRYASFAAFVDEVCGSTYNPYSRADVETAEVRRRFEDYRAGDGYGLRDDSVVDVFRGMTGSA